MVMSMLVELIYALPNEQTLLQLEVEQGCTVEQAILQSGLLERYPELELATCMVGLFSKPTSLQQRLNANDRIEIYRPLVIEPKEARRQRAKKKV